MKTELQTYTVQRYPMALSTTNSKERAYSASLAN